MFHEQQREQHEQQQQEQQEEEEQQQEQQEQQQSRGVRWGRRYGYAVDSPKTGVLKLLI